MFPKTYRRSMRSRDDYRCLFDACARKSLSHQDLVEGDAEKTQLPRLRAFNVQLDSIINSNRCFTEYFNMDGGNAFPGVGDRTVLAD